MADMSKLNENIALLSAKVDELVAYKAANPPVDNQAEVDAVNASVEAILARIP